MPQIHLCYLYFVTVYGKELHGNHGNSSFIQEPLEHPRDVDGRIQCRVQWGH